MQRLGEAAAALPLLRRAAEGFERLFGPEHPSSKTVRANCDRLERAMAAAGQGTGPAGAAPASDAAADRKS